MPSFGVNAMRFAFLGLRAGGVEGDRKIPGTLFYSADANTRVGGGQRGRGEIGGTAGWKGPWKDVLEAEKFAGTSTGEDLACLAERVVNH